MKPLKERIRAASVSPVIQLPEYTEKEPAHPNAPCRCRRDTEGRVIYEAVKTDIQGNVWPIDHCIQEIVVALNACGIRTVGCCCGHGERTGYITLADGRSLIIRQRPKSLKEWEPLDKI